MMMYRRDVYRMIIIANVCEQLVLEHNLGKDQSTLYLQQYDADKIQC